MDKLVIIESPYAGDFVRNNEYLSRAIADVFAEGNVPFASHGFFTRYLDENNPNHRKLGIESGYVIAKRADKIYFYADYAFTSGMVAALEFAKKHNIPYETRYIGINGE